MENQSKYPGVNAILSYWNSPSHIFGIYQGITEILSVRKPSPSFLIRALARSGVGLLLVGPDEKTGSHYLPAEEPPQLIVKRTQNLLELVGISPDRIQYKAVPKNVDPLVLLKEFSESLDNKKLKNLKITIPKTPMNPLDETMAILRIMWAKSEKKPVDNLISIQEAKTKDIAYFEGCMPILHHIGNSHKLFDLENMRYSIISLLNRSKINYRSIPDLSCPARGLLNLGIEGAEEIVKDISLKNINSVNKIKPKKIIIGSPEAYRTFTKEDKFGKLSSITIEIYNGLKDFKRFQPINKTVLLHRACLMEDDPFYESTKKLLSLIPGIKLIEFKDKCGQNGFSKIDNKSKKTADQLLKKAEKEEIDAIICTSPYCLSHLQLCQREGSWKTTDVEILDVYSLLISSLEEGDN